MGTADAIYGACETAPPAVAWYAGAAGAAAAPIAVEYDGGGAEAGIAGIAMGGIPPPP